MKDGIVVETGVAGSPAGGHALADEAGRVEKALLPHILMDGRAGLLFEEAHEVIAAEEDTVGKRVDGEVGSEVFIDIRKCPADFFIDGAVGAGTVGGRDAVNRDQQLGDQGVPHGVRTGAPVRKSLFEGGEQGAELLALALIRQKETLTRAVGRAETVHEAGGWKDTLEKSGVKIENNALIGGRDIDEGAVDGVVAYQKDGPGLQRVDGIFDRIVNLPREQEDYLVEIGTKTPGSIGSLGVLAGELTAQGSH